MNLLIGYKLPKNVVSHSKKVSRIALKVADELIGNGFSVNLDLVERGALLHDVGRCVTHGLEHGYFGGKILRKAGESDEVAKIAERHVLGGISQDEAEKMGLPAKDFIPQTLEEKIVCYADKLSERNKISRIEKQLGRNAAFERMVELMREVDEMRTRVQELNVYAVIRDSKGRILVMKRREPKIWEFPGGGIEWGETPEEAVKREVLEETDLKIKGIKLLCTSSKVYKKGKITKHSIYIVFEGRGEGKVKFGVEHSIAMWTGLKRIEKLELGLNVEPIVEYLKVNR